MVNSKLQTYLTDFLNRTFAGKIAKNGHFTAVRNSDSPAFTISALTALRRYENAASP